MDYRPPMKLDAYLSTHGLSQSEFAARIGVSQPAVAKYVAGKRIPHRDVMARIVAETDGLVGPADFYEVEAAE